MSHYRVPTKTVATGGNVERFRPPKPPGPSSADLALMRFVLGLTSNTPLIIETNATRSGHA